METADADEDGSCVRVSDDSRKLLQHVTRLWPCNIAVPEDHVLMLNWRLKPPWPLDVHPAGSIRPPCAGTRPSQAFVAGPDVNWVIIRTAVSLSSPSFLLLLILS